ncbi:hypothetical protein [Streptomyces sp. NPDC002853]
MRLGKALATGIAEEAPQERTRQKDLEQHMEPETEPAPAIAEPTPEVPAAR